MKRIIPLLVLIVAGIALSAQEEPTQPQIVLGGTMHISFENNVNAVASIIRSNSPGLILGDDRDFKSRQFSFLPYVGFDKDRWLFGIYGDSRTRYYLIEEAIISGVPGTTVYERKSYLIGGGLLARYRVGTLKRVRFFLQPRLGYVFMEEEEDFGNSLPFRTERAQFLEASIGVGTSINLTDTFRILLHTGAISYVVGNWEQLNSTVGNSFSSFQTDLSLSNIRLGVEFRMWERKDNWSW